MKLIALDGTVWDAVPVSENDLLGWPGCADCGQKVGSPHDVMCDRERCARCGAQAIACNCDTEERPEYEVEGARKVIAALTKAIEEATNG